MDISTIITKNLRESFSSFFISICLLFEIDLLHDAICHEIYSTFIKKQSKIYPRYRSENSRHLLKGDTSHVYLGIIAGSATPNTSSMLRPNSSRMAFIASSRFPRRASLNISPNISNRHRSAIKELNGSSD
ncbi:hypothetical protein M441DRAFT_436336 [Trichoderma asperellum CBS 433.97]|uniref:Uncharacterized protein n=1 Tax=Trichoderma asperellum (strain ATCC 204424 / CBS 433.97 / NBRC 101777) TaxID=1042311 RepID=A0A2T3Z3D7_TRIA4|nr:hypothetical protein M441DRAFT_436336 [Trichoderma asperellum CBS 433.97]PTB39331.1 hypothetical protein M441DRAFT_436336 [Trichoderma asperellum CBS 433.97]